MKRLAIAGAVLFGALATTAVALWLLSGDMVERAYPTLESARRDRLFERGWLPDVLPASSSHISVSSDLDLNTSRGSFELQPSEWSLLEAKLSVGELSAPFVDWGGTVAKHRERGLHPWHLTSPDPRRLFFCKPELGRCEYVMWMPPDG